MFSCHRSTCSPYWPKSASFCSPCFLPSDRFMGAINISNITSSSAALQWDQGPGDISHYRFEAFSRDNSWNVTKDMHNLSYTLVKLTPGTGYIIKVFAVKCERDLNPLNGSFYTSKWLIIVIIGEKIMRVNEFFEFKNVLLVFKEFYELCFCF